MRVDAEADSVLGAHNVLGSFVCNQYAQLSLSMSDFFIYPLYILHPLDGIENTANQGAKSNE